jgi:hypothetical protein
MRPRKALYFAANPPGTPSLDLEDEWRAIKLELRGARYRCFELVPCWASAASDLIGELREYKPAIVQLSGHACKAGGRVMDHDRAYRDVLVDNASDAEGGGGLVLHARNGAVHVASYLLIRDIFELAGSSVKLVVLTACGTEPLASMLIPHVDCAIGMDGPISDHAALEFSRGLYAALGDGASVEQAFQAGCLAIRCAGLPDAGRPKLRVRDGVDASHVVLAVIRRRRRSRSRRQPGPAPRRPSKRGARRGTRRTHRRGGHHLGAIRGGSAGGSS